MRLKSSSQSNERLSIYEVQLSNEILLPILVREFQEHIVVAQISIKLLMGVLYLLQY